MKTRIEALVFLALVLVCTVSCGAVKARTKGDGKVKIGFSIASDTFIIERWNKDVKIFSGAAHELGAEVLVQLSAGGTKEQIAQINFLLESDIDALVLIAHDYELLSGVVKKARDAKIPVIAYDRLIMGVPIDAYISFNNREVGRLFGKALLQQVPRGNYVIINGSVRDNNSYEVNSGLKEVLTPYIDSSAIKIVDEVWLNDWSSDEARAKMTAILERTTNIQAISCANDQIASAVIQLLAEYRLAGKVAVVGQDADIGACQKIVEGTQLMTVYKPLVRLASRAAEIAIALVRGNSLSPDQFIDNGSGSPVPYFVDEPLAVFKHNMDSSVIRDGFHSAEDVYRNVLVLPQQE